MSARISRIDPLDLYVTAIVAIGIGCMAWLGFNGADHLESLLSPEVAIFGLFALVGEFVPLKVFTRGAEGEVTTSTRFALAATIAAGPLAALIVLAGANLVADGIRRKPHKKVAFNVAQYAIIIVAAGAVMQLPTGLPRPAPHLVSLDLPGILLAAATFFVFNAALGATVIALVQRASVFAYLARDVCFQASTAG